MRRPVRDGARGAPPRKPPRPLLRVGRGGRSRSDREHYEPASLSVRRGGPTGLLLGGPSASRAPKCATSGWTRRPRTRFRPSKPKPVLRGRVCHERGERRAHAALAYVSAKGARSRIEHVQRTFTCDRCAAPFAHPGLEAKRATSHAVCGVARSLATSGARHIPRTAIAPGERRLHDQRAQPLAARRARLRTTPNRTPPP